MADEDRKDGEGLTIVDDCEKCEQKELCPIYMGQSCLLVKDRSIIGSD